MKVPIFVFVSGKGGVGKTTVSVNMAQLIMEAKNSVLFLDLDVFNRGATKLLIPQVKFEKSIATEYFSFRENPEVYKQSLDIQDLVIDVPSPASSNQYKLQFAPTAHPAINLTPVFADYNLEQMADFLSFLINSAVNHLDAKAVMIDCGPTPDPFAMAATRIATEVIIVTQADPVSFDGAKNIEFHIKANYPEYDPDYTYYIVNKVPPQKFASSDLPNMFSVISHRVLCYIPFEERVAAVFGDIPFVRELGFTTFESKIVVALEKVGKQEYPNIVPDEVKRIPPEAIEFYHKTLEIQKSFFAKVIKSSGIVLSGIGFCAILGTILASFIIENGDFTFLAMRKNTIQLLSVLLFMLGIGIFFLGVGSEKLSASLLELSKRQLGKTLLENKMTLKMLLKSMKRK